MFKNHIIFNPQLSMSSSNILNSESVLLNNKNGKFIQYNSTSSEIHPSSSKEKDIEGELQGEEKKAPSAKKITLHDFRAILTWENK